MGRKAACCSSCRCVFGLVIAVLFCAMGRQNAFAFDTGYHFDLTRDALVELGVPSGSDAVTIAQVANYYCDGFESAKAVLAREDTALIHEAWEAIYGPAELRDLSDTYMHFDALNNRAEVAAAWDRLLSNTYRGVLKAKREHDVRGFLMLLGMTTHMVQDFYAHSNWAEERNWGGDATWFDVSPSARASAAILTRNHERLNRDYAGRPFFEKSYRLAYYATVQWLAALREAAGDSLWNQAVGYRDSGLQLERHFVTYLSWYTGHWKGPSSASSDDLLVVALEYVNPVLIMQRKPYLDKWREYARIITGTPEPGAAAPFRFPYVEGRKWVKVQITEVRQTDDDLAIDIDPGGQADFYARVKVNGVEYREAMHEDQDQIRPSNWLTLAPIRPETENLRVEVQVVDEDTTAGQVMGRGEDDGCDISPVSGQKEWFIDGGVHLFPAEQSVHTDGGPDGDGDEAAVDFTLSLSEPSRGGRPPTVTSVSPSSLGRWSTGAGSDFTLRGANFYSPATVSFGPGIEVRRVEVVSATELRGAIYLRPGATLGKRTVSVSTACGTGRLPKGFTVVEAAAPRITGVAPASAQAGSSLEVTLTGENLYGASAVSFGPGIRVERFSVYSPRTGVYSLKASIAIAADAAPGRREVTVTRDGAIRGGGGAFTVLVAAATRAPIINSVSPDSGKQAKTMEVAIHGAHLSGTTAVSFGSDITVSDLRVVSDNEVRATLRISYQAALGPRTVTVITPSGRATRSDLFSVEVLLE